MFFLAGHQRNPRSEAGEEYVDVFVSCLVYFFDMFVAVFVIL